MKLGEILTYFWGMALTVIIVVMLFITVAKASTITLGYSECRLFNMTDETGTSEVDVCAQAYPSHVNLNLNYGETQEANNVTATCPAWVDLNITVCPPPPHVDFNLLWGQNASANNVTSTCAPWYDTNITTCLPPTSPPPIVNMSLVWGQTATQNNFTASCQAWYDTNMTTCPDCAILPQVSYNLTYSETQTFNNFTANCAAWKDLNITEPIINYIGCPQMNATIDLYPSNIYSNFTYGLVVNCHQSLVAPPVVYVQQALIPQTEYLNCNATEARVLNDRNLTLSITQCPVCSVCNLTRPDDQILDCSIKASFCYSDLQDLVNLDAFRNGTARTMFNTSKNMLLAQVSTANNGTIAAQTDLTTERNAKNLCEDKYAKLAGANEGNESVGWAILGVVIVGGGVWYYQDRERKTVVNPRNVVDKPKEVD